ncbi:MAG: putative aminohydrolase SsnA [Terracidiphilus sp.]|jgi:putative selenium metabolism protein SsnA
MAESANLLVGNGRVITHDDGQPFLENGCIAIQDGLIAAVGPTAEIVPANPDARFLDAQGRIIMPGLINAHTHLYSAFARGMALKDDAPGNFMQILERLWWRLDKALTLDDVYWSAMAGMVECIRNGVTTVFDHHSSPHAVRVSLFRIAEAARQTGLRACLCYEVSDRDGAEIATQGIEENRAFLETCIRRPESLIRGLFGLHASFTLGDATLAQCREAAADLGAGFHVHTAEALSDVDHCLREHNIGVVERWRQRGILGPHTLAAHCVHVSEREIDLLRESKTAVVHNPQSNMANAVGCAPVLEMMRRGTRVGLGTDGYTADMFESMKAASLLQKHHSGDPRAAWSEPPLMLFRENSGLASEHFGQPVGTLTPGAAADIILVDYDPPTPIDAANLSGHIFFGLTGRAVSTTIVGGRILMHNRKLLTIDESEVMAHARAAAAEVWKRF